MITVPVSTYGVHNIVHFDAYNTNDKNYANDELKKRNRKTRTEHFA